MYLNAKTRDKLLAHRTVVLTGDIEPDMGRRVIDQLAQLQFESASEPIKVYIDSPGGRFDVAMSICDFIEHLLMVPVHGYVLGECSSSATFVLLSCEKRICTPHAEFVVHNGTTSGVEFKTDKTTPKNLEDLLADVNHVVSLVVDFYAKRLGLSKEKVEKLLERGDQNFNRALSAEEALAVGLVTQIVDGKIGIFPAT